MLQRIADPTLTPDDLEHFDQYYSPQTIAEFRTVQGKRILVKRVYRPVIEHVLRLKVGTSFENVVRFLESRGEAVRDAELGYCLRVVADQHRMVYD